MKKIFPFLSRRFRPLLTTAIIYLSGGLLLRILLGVAFGRTSGAEWPTLTLALLLGAANDFTTLIYLLFPLTVLLLLAPKRLLASRFWQGLAAVSISACIFGTLYLGCVEYFFFDEFNARFNLVAVDYLIYPHEVFINIWESYHVLRFLLACGLATAFIVYLFRDALFDNLRPETRHREDVIFAGLHLVALILVSFGISTTSLAVTSNRVSNEIIANGISSLFRALHTNELDYPSMYPIMDTARAFSLMRDELGRRGGSLETQTSRDISRRFPAAPGLGKRNVVVIVEESFGAQFVGAYGDRQGLTPNFDRLAGQGLLFTNTYASGTRTVRGLEAIVTSLPPIPSEGIIKRPGSWPIANWGEVLRRQGYDTSFLYDGYGIFDNMNPFFGGNGFTLVDRNDIRPVTFSNIWGVCDQDLFNQALRSFDGEAEGKKPFFSMIMTTSNHSPYTFPAGIPGVPEKGGRHDGKGVLHPRIPVLQQEPGGFPLQSGRACLG